MTTTTQPQTVRERIEQRAAVRAANIKRLADKMAAWAERPNDAWAEMEATDAACHVFGDADGMHSLLADLMHDMGMDEEGFPLTDEGDTKLGADRRYMPLASAEAGEREAA